MNFRYSVRPLITCAADSEFDHHGAPGGIPGNVRRAEGIDHRRYVNSARNHVISGANGATRARPDPEIDGLIGGLIGEVISGRPAD